MSKIFSFILSFVVFFTACDIINPEEQIPSYLTIEPIILQTDAAREGSASSKITEGWVFVADEYIGAFSLPATIPVLASGDQTVRIQAGIRDNGINEVPEIYPFYETYVAQVNFNAAETTLLSPVIGYLPEVEFAFIEDFESGEHIFIDERDGNPLTEVLVTTDDVFEGTRSGKITLTADNPLIAVGTDPNQLFTDLQDNQVFVYVEVNYKSEVPVLWGVVGYPDGVFSDEIEIFDPGFNATEEWNKIYFNFSTILFNEKFPATQFVFTAGLPSENGSFIQEKAEIYLDNIKVVHF